MDTRKILAGIFAIVALISVGSAATLTWTSCTITMHAGTASTVDIGQYTDCACTIPIDSYDWNGVTQGNHYELHVYVKNEGTEAVHLTFVALDSRGYDGTTGNVDQVQFYDGQAKFNMSISVLEKGLPCQLYAATGDLPIKDIANHQQGFLLEPGKVVKVDVKLDVLMVVSGGTYDWTLIFEGATVE